MVGRDWLSEPIWSMCRDWAFGIRNETTKFISTIPPPAENAYFVSIFFTFAIMEYVDGGRGGLESPKGKEK